MADLLSARAWATVMRLGGETRAGRHLAAHRSTHGCCSGQTQIPSRQSCGKMAHLPFAYVG